MTKKSDDKKNKLSKQVVKKNTTETPTVKGMFSLKNGLKRCKDLKYSEDCKKSGATAGDVKQRDGLATLRLH